jgi:hypothetical protein
VNRCRCVDVRRDDLQLRADPYAEESKRLQGRRVAAFNSPVQEPGRVRRLVRPGSEQVARPR